MSATHVVPAGWYADPELANTLRWWDGTRWTEHRAPAGPAAAHHVSTPAPAWLVPTNLSGWAVASGYLGLVGLLFPLGLAAVVTGVVAMVKLRASPELRGRGRAVFGIVAGSLWTLAVVAAVIVGR